MLVHLSIRNFALIERLDLELDRGLIVLTGETGAGKSIVFDAMSLLVGARASADFVRAGEDEGSVQGMFVVDDAARGWLDPLLDEAGVPASGELVIRRTLTRRGANRVYINDALTTVGLLARVLDPLVEVVGQHEHLTMVRPDTHRALLDRFGNHDEPLAAMHAAYDALQAARQRLAALEGASAARGERVEFLRFQRDELQRLHLRAGEAAELERSLHRARNLGKLRESSQAALEALVEGDGAAVDRVGAAAERLARLAAADPALTPLRERLDEANALVADVAAELRRYARGLEADDGDLDAMEARHEALRRAMRKHNTDEAGLLERLSAMSTELATLENYDDALAQARADEARNRAAAEREAERLDGLRTSVAEGLFGDVRATLATLGMPHATLAWTRTGARRLGRFGWEGWEILFGANPGEAVGSIAKLASGGELSRLTLAVKTAAAATDRLQTYTFDEVDSGIGGATADVVGQLLARLARERQVICVTHHAQIAAYADTHLVAEKAVADGRTRSTLRRVSDDTRRMELARMLGGVDDHQATHALAATMLEAARQRARGGST